jgi:hypothetical protein
MEQNTKQGFELRLWRGEFSLDYKSGVITIHGANGDFTFSDHNGLEELSGMLFECRRQLNAQGIYISPSKP